MAPDPSGITVILQRWNAGDPNALEELTPVIYNELHKLAQSLLWRERPGQTLSATALVHEVYLRLVGQRKVSWENRAHFFGASARIMRRVLIDNAKAKLREKRGGSAEKVAMHDQVPALGGFVEDVLALDIALEKLAKLDERKARVVEMKYFGGMTNEEVAEALNMSGATVERDWKMARAWLINEMT